MQVYTKKLLSFLLVFVILLSSMNVILSVFATEPDVSFELNGGTLQGSSSSFGAGDILPNYENVTKAGAIFGGWYADADFTGNQVFTVPADLAESTTYYARWIISDTNFDNFDSYTTYEELASHWEDWKYPATGSVTSLNTDSNHAYSGNSMKVCLNEANKATQLAVSGDFPKNGAGIAFWIESTSGAAVYIKFNNKTELVSQVKNVPAGKQIVTIPWSDINGALDAAYLWQTILFVSVPNADDVVYIDSIGTYNDYVESNVSFNMNGGIWADGYTAPNKYNTGGVSLPGVDDIKNDGLAFAGWYDNAALTGSPVYSIAPGTSGDKEYWAKWIIHDVNFENFDSYDTNEDMLNDNHWSDWKYPATGSVASLNADSNHAYSGNSMKICPNAADKASQLAITRVNYPQIGDGIAFWMESANGATVYLKFNNNTELVSQVRNVPAGKQIVTIPWSEIDGALTTAYLWQTSLFISVPNAEDAVYIDEIGTYKEDVSIANTVTYYTLGGNWAGGYTAPTKYTAAGDKLPAYGSIVKQDYLFAGWYDNKDYSGKPVTVTPESGDIKLYAKWINAAAEFENFESYTDDNTDWEAWTSSTTPTLNTEIKNVCSGTKSLKLGVAAKETYNDNYAVICKQATFNKAGNGVSFWIKSEIATVVQFAFNNRTKDGYFVNVNVPAGKSYVTIPWAEFTALADVDSFWCVIISIATGSRITNTVYIDDIGTYAAIECDKAMANWENGFSYFLDDDGKTVWNYSKTTGSEESSYIGFATDYMLEKDKKYVIAFDYKYLKEGRLSWSLEPQAVGNAFDESLIKQQTDENRQTLNDKNLNSDWSIMKIAFAATSVTDENKYLAFFGKTNPNAEYDISMKNIRLYTLGDVDFSGGIDTLDLTVLKKYLLGADSTAEFTDVNDDINTDIRDLIALKKILAK